MQTTTFLLVSFSFPLTLARLGQGNKVEDKISPLFATLASQPVRTLLAASNTCDKLSLADKVAALGGQAAIDVAKALV